MNTKGLKKFIVTWLVKQPSENINQEELTYKLTLIFWSTMGSILIGIFGLLFSILTIYISSKFQRIQQIEIIRPACDEQRI